MVFEGTPVDGNTVYFASRGGSGEDHGVAGSWGPQARSRRGNISSEDRRPVISSSHSLTTGRSAPCICATSPEKPEAFGNDLEEADLRKICEVVVRNNTYRA